MDALEQSIFVKSFYEDSDFYYIEYTRNSKNRPILSVYKNSDSPLLSEIPGNLCQLAAINMAIKHERMLDEKQEAQSRLHPLFSDILNNFIRPRY